MLRATRRWFPSLSSDDLDDLYQSAWLSALRTQATIENVEAYLYEAAHSQGLMELRRRRRRPVESLDQPPIAGESAAEQRTGKPVSVTAEAPTDEQVEERLLSGLVEEVLAELTPRQRQVAKLRWGWGLSRDEIARALQLSPRSVKRELRAASEHLAKLSEVVRAGRWCEHKRSLITAYALVVLSPARAAQAKRHLDSCAGCRALVLEQRSRADWLGALLPAPLAGAPESGNWDGLAAVVDQVRERAAELAFGAKQQVALVSSRASDPTPLAGARPGAVAFVIAGCVAAGGSTYCAVEGVPDLLTSPRIANQVQDDAAAEPPVARQEPQEGASAPPTQPEPLAPVAPPPPVTIDTVPEQTSAAPEDPDPPEFFAPAAQRTTDQRQAGRPAPRATASARSSNQAEFSP